MKICISADWHIDKDNRLEDIEHTLADLVDKVLFIHPQIFIFAGDGFKNWRPTPLEMFIFRNAIFALSLQKIKVIILVGNHDYPESDELRGKHCFTEFADWDAGALDRHGNIQVIDSPRVLDSGKIDAFFIPHIPKSSIPEGKTYNDVFMETLDAMVSNNKGQIPTPRRPIIFSHCYIDEAKVGAGDMVLSGNRHVCAGDLRKRGFDLAFFGDIHKAQRIEPGYFYPGSIERVDFGEREDIKGFIVYDDQTDKSEFVELNARKMNDIVIDLQNPGLLKPTEPGMQTGGNPIEPSAVMEYISAQLQVMAEAGEFVHHDAIVRVKIIGTKEQKAMIEEDVLAKLLLDTVNVHKINAIGYDITDGTTVRNAEINESLNPAGALNKWIGMQSYKEEMENRIRLEGEKIIKG